MDFDRALDPRVVRHLDVGVAPADMREHHAILVLQRLEEVLSALLESLHTSLVSSISA